MFMLEVVHVAHIKTVQLHEISTGDLLTYSENIQYSRLVYKLLDL